MRKNVSSDSQTYQLTHSHIHKAAVTALVAVLALFPSIMLEAASPVQSRANTIAPAIGKTRQFVRLVIAKKEMTFEGARVTWDILPARLEALSNRHETVLELAVATESLSLAQLNETVARARKLSAQFGLDYVSYIGVERLGSRGSPPLKLAVSGREADSEGLIEEYVKRALDLRQKLTEFRQAQTSLANASHLYKANSISEASYNEARRKLELCKAALRNDRLATLKLELEAAEEELGRVTQLLKINDFANPGPVLQQAQNRVDLAKLELEAYPEELPEGRSFSRTALEFQQANADLKSAQILYREGAMSTNNLAQFERKSEGLKLQFEFAAVILARAKRRQAEANLASVVRGYDSGENSADELKQGEATVASLRAEEEHSFRELARSAERHLDVIQAAQREGLIPESEYLEAKRAIDDLNTKINQSAKTR
jgi:hypothetical protein